MKLTDLLAKTVNTFLETLNESNIRMREVYRLEMAHLLEAIDARSSYPWLAQGSRPVNRAVAGTVIAAIDTFQESGLRR